MKIGGLIEAAYCSAGTALLYLFPPMKIGGLIEATHARKRQRRNDIFPPMKIGGLIEAEIPKGKKYYALNFHR